MESSGAEGSIITTDIISPEIKEDSVWISIKDFLTTACRISHASYLQNIKTAMKNYSIFRKPKIKFTSGDSGKCGFIFSLSLSHYTHPSSHIFGVKVREF